MNMLPIADAEVEHLIGLVVTGSGKCVVKIFRKSAVEGSLSLLNRFIIYIKVSK